MMGSLTSLSTKQRLFIVSSVVFGSILLTARIRSSGGRSGQQSYDLPIIKTEAKCLKFISLERINRRFVTTMKNISEKAITGYVVAVCDVPESAVDYSIGSNSIEPGQVVEITTPVMALSDQCASAATQPTITVLAVVFDDKSTDGEYGWAKGILDDRHGHRIQLRRINQLLRASAKWSDRNEATAIERLNSQISSLPVDEDETPSVRGGLAAAKQRILFYLSELDQWHESTMQSASASERNRSHRGELAGISGIEEGVKRLVSLNDEWISKY